MYYSLEVTCTTLHTDAKIREPAWQAFLIPYWEGRIKILGSHNETGFMQLSGY